MTAEKPTNDFHYDIVKKLAVLSTDTKGWTKEVNLISFNGQDPVFDVRKWSPGGRMSRGITLKQTEVAALITALTEYQSEMEN
ncbi:TPA: hypothetical protein U1B12_001067 [Streptococcus suis]|uniref:YdbC family protein n=1 Tax=Streptococcus suis TaxID=1307 RepID=UPI000CF4D987|nr:PC4/YdbC family ssDNA-binding protein [Streptococcus suis]MCO8200845.1 PC4/YdbC family ssDNA-binding protein [Streptococcus suis]MCO8218382.1 PC4/YdbC family ssDNA-binding protein [Streptococcus suis]HEM3467932.1 hypothetical protein [Streptococcus suis]HEM3478643.1 hypothetical protein [Streptococcus suis]